jgi:hypothetical protein
MSESGWTMDNGRGATNVRNPKRSGWTMDNGRGATNVRNPKRMLHQANALGFGATYDGF